MSTNIMSRRIPKNEGYASTRYRVVRSTVTALDKSMIAAIPASMIEQMTRDELLLLIRVADVPLWCGKQCDELLARKDMETLRRMAYLARHCCQNQIQMSAHAG